MPQAPQNKSLWISEVWIDVDEGCRLGESGVYETYHTSVSALFKAMKKEYGGGVSKMYLTDARSGKSRQVGWVFKKRKKYDDSKKTFLMETWVSVHTKPPTVTTTYHYKKLGG